MSGPRLYVQGSLFSAQTSDQADLQERAFWPYQGVAGDDLVSAHPRQLQAAINAVAARRDKKAKRGLAGAAMARGPVSGATSISRPVAR